MKGGENVIMKKIAGNLDLVHNTQGLFYTSMFSSESRYFPYRVLTIYLTFNPLYII